MTLSPSDTLIDILPPACASRKYVPGAGPQDAPIVLIGEAPGETEDQQGRPFCGKAGDMLNRLLSAVGINRADCYITNVVKVRPPSNKLDRLPEIGLSIDSFLPSFYEELEALNPNAILVPLGGLGLRVLTGLESITKWRGSILRESGKMRRLMVPTLHPSYVMQYAFTMYPAVAHDLLRAKTLSREGFNPTPRAAVIEPSLNAIMEYLEKVKHSPMFAWDLETIGEQVSCIGFAISKSDSMCVPLKRGTTNFWPRTDEVLIWEKVGEVMGSPALKIAQNGFAFDNFYMDRLFGCQPRAPHFDTILAHRLLYPDLPHGLDFITSIYTDIPYYKDDTKDKETGKKFSSKTKPEVLWEYNCKDVLATFEAATKMMGELHIRNMLDYFMGYTMPLYRMLFEVQKVGAVVDVTKRQELKDAYTVELAAIQVEVDEVFGRKINLDSPKQLSAVLYTELKLPVQYTLNAQKKRVPTVGAEALAYLGARHNIPILSKIIKFKSLRTIKSTFLEAQESPDGRMRTRFGTTNTGRLSSTGMMDGTGMNLLNIPKREESKHGEEMSVSKNIRMMFGALPDWELMEVDYAQAEARDVAGISQCIAMMEEFTKPGGDVFKRLAAKSLGIAFEDVTKPVRQEYKPGVHGCVSGDHEILTKNGWVAFNETNQPSIEAAVWCSDFTIKWEECNIVREDHHDVLHQWEGTTISILGTPCHTMPTYTTWKSRQYIKEHPLDDFPRSGRIPLVGTLNGFGSIDEIQLRLAVAIQADGSYTKSGVRFHFHKRRKKDRLEYLMCFKRLKEVGTSGNHYEIPYEEIEEAMTLLNGKLWKLDELLSLTPKLREILLDELLEWDGSDCRGVSGRQSAYYTTIEENARTIQTVAHLSGRQGLVRVETNREGCFGDKPLWRVSFNVRKFADIGSIVKKRTDVQKCTVFCLNTTTGYFLMRHKGSVFISGNSNYLMGINKFALQLKMTPTKAKIVQGAYFHLYPEVPMWHQWVRGQLLKCRTIVTALGRSRITFDRLPYDGKPNDTWREMQAFQPQSEVGELMNLAMKKLQLTMPDLAEIWLSVYDSILLHYPSDLRGEVMECVRYAFDRPIVHHGKELNIPIEVCVGKNWGELKEIKI